jgi:hypothetical protein
MERVKKFAELEGQGSVEKQREVERGLPERIIRRY